ncbi:hypothetical protein LT679_18025 [Mucilaginibacter roseus]|uniref:DUF4145 domain-containing protein n=1 Tax=Mucilaginibacter roseus TaxID=1528868 RepID=A0ABS8U5W2_9SPHI|nr:hypothetical protein [Mucilaginibacter roseus]MCD8742513.1 hypothetical protein [Mucilaginibacter roseus]
MDSKTKQRIAEFICGDNTEQFPIYRSSQYLSRFFNEIGINVTHDGSTRKWWVLSVINGLNGIDLQKVILRLVSPKLYGGNREQIKLALSSMNEILEVECLKVVFDGLEPKLRKHTPNYNFEQPIKEKKEEELKPLPPPNWDALNLEYGIADILQKRWEEVQRCIDGKANLSALIMMGSMLEGLLLGVMQNRPQIANTAKSTPKKDGKPKHFAEWSLSELIDVAHDNKWIHLDVKKFSHALREFRNLVHPYQQLVLQTFPDIDTINISWLVVQAACNHIADWLKRNPK